MPLARDNNNTPVQALRPNTSLTAVTLSGTSAQSGAVSAATTVVRLASTVDCFVAIGANPTAVLNTCFLPAGSPEYFRCEPGDKVAGISSGSGSLYITQMD